MNDTACTYQGDREETLIAFVYDELPPDARQAFEAHLASCPACRTEFAGLGLVRTRLQQWVPPEPVGALRDAGAVRPSARWAALRDIPVWAQVAAAMLFLGAAAGLANLRVTVGPQGLSVSTGWVNRGLDAARSAPPANVASRQDLAALETVLRAEIKAASDLAVKSVPVVDMAAEREEIMRGVRGFVASREQEQRRDVALQVAEMYRTVQSQRQGDLARIDKVLDTREYLLRRDALYQQRQLNAITQQVTQRR
jgi:anti-sigma factor RsiW